MGAYPESQLHETMTIYPGAGHSASGPLFGEEYDEACYLEPGFKTVTDSKGQEVVSSLFGIFRAECSIAANDEGEWDGQRYRAIDVQRLRVKGVAHHVEIYFGSVAG